jgi:hypothetical protein
VTGIEPVWVAWKATARPLGHTRLQTQHLAVATHWWSHFNLEGCDSTIELLPQLKHDERSYSSLPLS